MHDTLKQLIATEAVCSEIDRLDAEIAKFPGEEAVVAEGVRRGEAVVVEARAALEHEELEERRLESAMRDQEALILKLNHQSAAVASNQAYTALQNELEAAEAAKTEFETQALEHMEAIDAATDVVARVEAEFEKTRAAAPEQLAEIDERRKQAHAGREVAVERHARGCEGIDPKLLKRFETIRSRKQPAIVVLESNSCPRCKIVLPRLRLSEIARLQGIYEGTSCKRLLAPAKALE